MRMVWKWAEIGGGRGFPGGDGEERRDWKASRARSFERVISSPGPGTEREKSAREGGTEGESSVELFGKRIKMVRFDCATSAFVD